MTVIREAPTVAGRRPLLTGLPRLPERLPRVRKVEQPKPPSTLTVVYSYVLTMVSIVLVVLLGNIIVISQLQHFSAQHRLYDELRYSLAEGSTPIGQLDVDGKLVTPGTPVALLQIPEIGLREVVVDGTASRQTKLGVGHRPDTPLPGQPGVSVLMGRAAAYGGPFGQLDKLRPGDLFSVTTGQGVARYKVLGARTGNTKLPALTATGSRLTLVTATGGAFLPQGVLRIDADLVSPSFPRPPIAFAPGVIDDSEQALAGDPSRLFGLSWLLELLVLLTFVAVWAWKRWSHPATWVVFTPVLAAVGLACADHLCDLLPNLM